MKTLEFKPAAKLMKGGKGDNDPIENENLVMNTQNDTIHEQALGLGSLRSNLEDEDLPN